MKYNINVLCEANRDLYEIHEYLSEMGENAPKKFKSNYEKFIGQVSNMPFIFPQYAGKPNYRKAPIAYDYLAFYKVDKKRKTVEIYRILNSKRNIENELI